MSDRIQVAGIGNIFFGDDGFGVEVVRRLPRARLPAQVSVVDYGISGIHLAYDLLDPPQLLIIVDALPRRHTSGTLYVLEPDLDGALRTQARMQGADAHGMDLPSVFSMVRSMGGVLPRMSIVGCEPADLGESLGLSPSVARAVDPAIELVLEIIEREGRSPEAFRASTRRIES